MALVGLVRVSTANQETQRQHDARDPICVRVFEERVSGKLAVDDRPGLKTAIDFMRDGEMLAVQEVDRLGRNLLEGLVVLNDLFQRGCTVKVLVSRSVQHYMPQRLTHVEFSGMTIRDNKVPYIFLAGGDHGDDQEPVGRTIFTLALMTVLVARRIFAPMTWDGGSAETGPGREYDIAGAMLMPTNRMKELRPTSLADMKAAADEFKVTASAVTVRALRLGIINRETASNHLDELRSEFRRFPKGGPRSPIHPENAVRKYNGRELTVRMLHALDGGSISPGEFCRSICLNNLKPSRIDDLRRAVE